MAINKEEEEEILIGFLDVSSRCRALFHKEILKYLDQGEDTKRKAIIYAMSAMTELLGSFIKVAGKDGPLAQKLRDTFVLGLDMYLEPDDDDAEAKGMTEN